MSHQHEQDAERIREWEREREKRDHEEKRHDHVEEQLERVELLEGAQGLGIFRVVANAFVRTANALTSIARSFEKLVEQHAPPPPPKLTFVKLQFELGGNMALGSVTIPNLGQKTKATLKGFDQNGQPMPASFVMPAVTYTLDNPALDSIVGDGANGADITSLASGSANLTAQVTSAEGLALSDTQSIINLGGGTQPPPTPVLTSVKIDFTTPA